MTEPVAIAALVERLRVYSEAIVGDGDQSEQRLRVGPHMCSYAMTEAADTLTTLQSRIEQLERERDKTLVALYHRDGRAAGLLCDTEFDKSGALLGRIRATARALTSEKDDQTYE